MMVNFGGFMLNQSKNQVNLNDVYPDAENEFISFCKPYKDTLKEVYNINSEDIDFRHHYHNAIQVWKNDPEDSCYVIVMPDNKNILNELEDPRYIYEKLEHQLNGKDAIIICGENLYFAGQYLRFNYIHIQNDLTKIRIALRKNKELFSELKNKYGNEQVQFEFKLDLPEKNLSLPYHSTLTKQKEDIKLINRLIDGRKDSTQNVAECMFDNRKSESPDDPYLINAKKAIIIAIRNTLQHEEDKLLNTIDINSQPRQKLVDYFTELSQSNPLSYPAKKLLIQAKVFQEMEKIPGFKDIRFEDVWKFVIDGKKWKDGAYAFENEPGYIVATLQGMLTALQARKDIKTPDWYINIHDTCVNEVRSQFGQRENISKNVQTGTHGFYLGQQDRDELGLQDLEKQKRGEWLTFHVASNKLDAHKGNEDQIRERINNLLSGYHHLLDEAKDAADKLIAHLWLVRELEIHHVFSDGNGRSSMLALQCLASGANSGILPMLFWDPNILDANSPHKLCQRAIVAMKRCNPSQSNLEQIAAIEKQAERFLHQSWDSIHAKSKLNQIYNLQPHSELSNIGLFHPHSQTEQGHQPVSSEQKNDGITIKEEPPHPHSAK